MNKVLDPQLMAERIESLKAGLLGCLCLAIAFLITTLVNDWLPIEDFKILSTFPSSKLDLRWFTSAGIAAFCGLLFGVTYRYIIRSERNFQLKSGGVLAFGLVRGLTQVDSGLSCSNSLLPLVIMGIESILWFGLAAFAIDTAFRSGWIKTFQSNDLFYDN
ncbi:MULTISPECIES: hypothetical protein [Nostocales]|uniref:Uncharacterized protein n=2 Tax=Nostocales TaxID=1161 RepID=A0ABW8WQ50_9CYAN|nr:hypothetical protein [Tolypothrix bouteillei]